MAHERQDPEFNPAEKAILRDLSNRAAARTQESWKQPADESDLHDRVTSTCAAIGADLNTLYAETKGDSEVLQVWMRFCEPRAALLAQVGAHWIRNAEQPVLKCLRCKDTAYIHGTTPRGNSAAMVCTCEAALQAEAGWWFEALYPKDDRGRRHLRDAAKETLERYCAKHKRDIYGLKARIARLKDAYDARRKRSDLEGMD